MSRLIRTSDLVGQIAARRRIVTLGDSITADAFSSNSWSLVGWSAWFRRLMGNEIYYPAANNFAVAGDTVAQVLAGQLAPAIAANPDIAFVFVGTNSIGVETVATMISEYTQIFQGLLSNGAFVITIPIRVHNSTFAWSGTQLLQVSRINRWMADYCASTTGMLLLDVNNAYLDFSTGNAATAYLRDGIHDNLISAQLMGQLAATAVSNLIPATDTRFKLLGDAYDATNNVTGNLLTNGLLAGTSGNVFNHPTGVAPTGWNGLCTTNGGTSTVVFSNVADSSLLNLTRSRQTISGTGDSNTSQLTQTINSNFAIGDVLQLEAELNYNISSGIFLGVGITLIFQDSGFATLGTAQDGFVWSGSPMAVGSASGIVFKSEPTAVPTSTANIGAVMSVFHPASATMSATFDWGRISMRKIIAGG